MKRSCFFIVLALLASGCSYADVLSLVNPTPLPPPASETAMPYMTPTETASITPTQPTPTFTMTPTLIYPYGAPPPSPTITPVATLWVLPSSTAEAVMTPLQGNGPFSTVLVSGRQLFWESCEPNSVKATVKVASGVKASTVLIMLRLQDTKTKDTTPWGGGAIMEKAGDGVFTYTLTAKSFEHYRDYMKAWGQYQFVAFDRNLKRLGASTQYLNNLVLEPCR